MDFNSTSLAPQWLSKQVGGKSTIQECKQEGRHGKSQSSSSQGLARKEAVRAEREEVITPGGGGLGGSSWAAMNVTTPAAAAAPQYHNPMRFRSKGSFKSSGQILRPSSGSIVSGASKGSTILGRRLDGDSYKPTQVNSMCIGEDLSPIGPLVCPDQAQPSQLQFLSQE